MLRFLFFKSTDLPSWLQPQRTLMVRLVVSTQSLMILASEKSVFTVLRYHPHEINGRHKYIMSLAGARSDTRLLQASILDMRGHKLQLILYDSAGCEQRLMVSCSPYTIEGVLVGCLVDIYPSDATYECQRPHLRRSAARHPHGQRRLPRPSRMPSIHDALPVSSSLVRGIG